MSRIVKTVVMFIFLGITTTAFGQMPNSKHIVSRDKEIIGAYAIAGSNGYGAKAEVISFLGSSNFNWSFSAGISSNKDYGALSNALLSVGYKFGGNKFYVLPSIGAGYGQYGKNSFYQNADKTANFDKLITPWTPQLEAACRLGFIFGRVGLSLIGGYNYNFKQIDVANLPNNLELVNEIDNLSNWYVGLGVSYGFGLKRLGGGDRSFSVGAYALTENGNLGFGTEIGFFRRSGARGGLEYGVQSQWVLDSEYPTNEIAGFGGYRFLPWGAESILSFSVGARVGIGNYACSYEAATDDLSFVHTQRVLGVFGGSLGAYAKLGLRVTRWLDISAGASIKGVLTSPVEASGDGNYAIENFQGPCGVVTTATLGLGFYF